MCDYSLAGVPSRLAEDGEQLVVHRFPSRSKGLVAPGDLRSWIEGPVCKTAWSQLCSAFTRWFTLPSTPSPPAACLPPGTELMLRDIPAQLQEQLDVGAEEPATFTQWSAEAYEHRDAIRFTNGKEVLLQRLDLGQRVDVLCVTPATPPREELSAMVPSQAKEARLSNRA